MSRPSPGPRRSPRASSAALTTRSTAARPWPTSGTHHAVFAVIAGGVVGSSSCVGVSARVRSSFPARVRSATLLTADVAVAVLRALAVGAWWVSGAGPQRSSPTRAATGHTGWLHQRRQLHQRRRLRRQRRRLRWRLRRDSRAAGTQRRSRRRGTNQRGSLGGRKARPRPSYFDHQYAFV